MVAYPWKTNRATPKEDVKTYAPKIITRRILMHSLEPCRPGGKVIQELQATGTTIVINEDPITEEGVIEI
jgi:polyribonucleotide nucleotidyltransferase